MPTECLYCQTHLEGRADKKFCSPYCRSAYHYQASKGQEISLFQRVDKQLKMNRRLLKTYNKAGMAKVRKGKLLQDGFDPRYFTNYWKNKENKVYLFCYEFGFLDTGSHYLLITWQPYMARK